MENENNWRLIFRSFGWQFPLFSFSKWKWRFFSTISSINKKLNLNRRGDRFDFPQKIVFIAFSWCEDSTIESKNSLFSIMRCDSIFFWFWCGNFPRLFLNNSIQANFSSDFMRSRKQAQYLCPWNLIFTVTFLRFLPCTFSAVWCCKTYFFLSFF